MKVVLLAALTLGAAVLPVGAGVRVNPAEAAQVTRAAHPCQNIQLHIQAQSSQGAAGHIAIIFRIHNLRTQACSLSGYPGVQLLDGRFLTLPTSVHRGPGNLVGAIPARRIHVAGHGNAYFALGYSDVPFRNQPCETAYYLMIFAPNDILPVVTYASGHHGSITACSGNLNVSPVTARPRYQ